MLSAISGFSARGEAQTEAAGLAQDFSLELGPTGVEADDGASGAPGFEADSRTFVMAIIFRNVLGQIAKRLSVQYVNRSNPSQAVTKKSARCEHEPGFRHSFPPIRRGVCFPALPCPLAARIFLAFPEPILVYYSFPWTHSLALLCKRNLLEYPHMGPGQSRRCRVEDE